MRGHIQGYAPRCSWLQRLVDQEIEQRRRNDYVLLTQYELEDLRRDPLKRGYDPYNTADLTPQWLRVGR